MSDAAAKPAPVRDQPLIDRLEQLWRRGERPDPYAFLDAAGPCTPAAAAEVLSLDQWFRWHAGERVPAEAYFQRRPELATDAELAVQLVYGEFLVREALGERPSAAEFTARFPAFADRLRQQVELHQALQTDDGFLDADRSHPWERVPTLFPASSFRPQAARGDAPALPENFGRYRILDVLGSGGMGTVYRARDIQLGREVALKVPHFDVVREAPLVERFYREARIAATFHHPDLCAVYDVGQHAGVHYLTMPLLRGEPLSALIRREGALPRAEALRLAARVARAVQIAHAAGVIHRDLKPANIMIDARGEPVVMDFGLARRSAAPDPRLTSSGVVLGTPLYSPPEQVWGNPEGAGPACDVYSLGVILYEMLTGRVPFRGALHEVLEQALTRTPVPPSQARPGLDPRLDAVCLRAMVKDPAARFASMAEFAAALEALIEDGGPGAPSTPRAGSRRRWLGATFGLGALAAIVWGASAGRSLFQHPTADPLPAGSRWSGTFNFEGTPGVDFDIALAVESREGRGFRGVCATQEGQFQWAVEGTIEGDAIAWSYTRVIAERSGTGPLGAKHVKGTCRAGRIEALYTDSDSAANLRLWRVEGASR